MTYCLIYFYSRADESIMQRNVPKLVGQVPAVWSENGFSHRRFWPDRNGHVRRFAIISNRCYYTREMGFDDAKMEKSPRDRCSCSIGAHRWGASRWWHLPRSNARGHCVSHENIPKPTANTLCSGISSITEHWRHWQVAQRWTVGGCSKGLPVSFDSFSFFIQNTFPFSICIF